MSDWPVLGAGGCSSSSPTICTSICFTACSTGCRWLWRIHEAHHATADVDWISGARSHPLEILINQTIEFAPIVLLGAAPEVALIKGVLDAAWGMYIHSNIDVRSGRLQYLINGPEMHRWHHAREIVDVNFATKLAIWDWLFGTAYHPGASRAATGWPPAAFLRAISAKSSTSSPAARSSQGEGPEHTRVKRISACERLAARDRVNVAGDVLSTTLIPLAVSKARSGFMSPSRSPVAA